MSAPAGFNEAGAKKPRIGPSALTARPLAPDSFNEAGAKKPRIGSAQSETNALISLCFNEAGAKKPRIGHGAAANIRDMILASMRPGQRSPG